MAHEPTCQHCGAKLQPNTFFCGDCGKATPPAPSAPKPAPKGTMMMGIPALVAPPVAPAPAGPAPADDAGRTTKEGISQPPRGAMGRTMLGIPLTPLPPAPPSSGAPPPEPARPGAGGKSAAKTMMGLPIPVISERPPAPSASSSSVESPGAASERDPSFARTLVGGPDEGLADTDPMRSAIDLPSSASRPQSNARTMMGLEDDAALADDMSAAPALSASQRNTPPADRQSPARGSRPSSSAGRASARSVPRMRRGPSPIVLGLAMIAMAGAAVLGFMALRPAPGPAARVRVMPQAEGEGENMVFEVPGAPAGTKLRFGGQEKPLEAGRATFPLAQDSLRVGKNVVVYDLVQPGGEVTSDRVTLAVDYRVTLDTGPLRAGKAAVDVVVAALPGSQVWLDGALLALDAQGRAVRSDPLEPSGTSGRIDHVVRYRVQPPAGEASVGELRTSIAVTMMEIDKPGAEVTTDRDNVEIAGAVDKDARVTIDGQPVPVASGRFLYSLPLPQPGEYRPEVVATSEGKAPHAIKLAVTRVPDLTEAAKSFTFDAELNYAKIAQNPAIYRGQRVALEGRVYNVNVEGGRSALQMLVRDCPSGQRCPVWVGYHAATEFTVDSWVRVLGVIEGEQQFRSESDEIKVVPKVEATFLLPVKP